MTSQPLLISVPVTHPTRAERLAAYKARHGIETHESQVDPPWLAVGLSAAKNLYPAYIPADADLFNAMAHACRIIEDAGLTGYGATEEAAIEDLAAKNNWEVFK